MIAILSTIALVLCALPFPTHSFQKRQDAHGKTIIAYYASWQWYDRAHLAKPSNLDMSKVTRFNFAFFQPNAQGDIWGTDSWADAIVLFGEFDWSGASTQKCSWDAPGEPPVCAAHHVESGLIYLAHQAGVEVYPSIGGWTLSDNFPAMAANPAARAKFAQNCVKLIQDYDFDGIDIDWEYPGYADHSGTPADTENYSLLLKEIREALDALGSETGRFYGLTAALPCGPSLIGNIQVDVVKDYMTELNLMTYDFFGSWSPYTGVNAPLYDQEGDPELSVHGCVQNWIKGGGRNDQINIGFPFYGRSFSGHGINGLYQQHDGNSDTITWSDDEGSPQYFNIMAKINQFTVERDEQTKTAIMYNSNGFVSFDDEQAICDKTEYAMDHGLNGYIIWEISGDVMPDLSTPLLDAANNKLNNPDMPCDPNAPSGGIVNTGDKVDPWYAKKTTGICVNDGKQDPYLHDYELYSSLAKCCRAAFAWDSETCMSASVSGNAAGKWYASDGGCVSEGNFPEWLQESDIFVTKEDCCDAKFSWDASCLTGETASTAANVVTTAAATTTTNAKATATTTKAATTPPATTTTTTTKATVVITTTQLPVEKIEEVKATKSPTSNPTSKPSESWQNDMPTQSLFYPYYGDDGTEAKCFNDGNFPAWFSKGEAATSHTSCCETFFLPDQIDDCKAAIEESPFYPNFEDVSCVNDGDWPEWFGEAGDYLSANKFMCCSNFFSSSTELMNRCIS